MINLFSKTNDFWKSIKIIMNSCYGVLATGACRFADPNLVTAITSLGHHLLRWVQALLEDEGYHVIYGDTDSLFVDPKFPNNVRYAEAMEKGKRSANSLTES